MNEFQEQRELCLSLKQRGYTRKQIAEELGMSERQVKRRLANASAADTSESTPILAVFQPDLFSANILPSQDTDGWERLNPRMVDGEGQYPRMTLPMVEELPPLEEPLLLSSNGQLFDYRQIDRQRQEVQARVEARFAGRPVKVLYLADLHIPFTDYDTVYKIVEANRDANVCVVNGDLLDLFAVSKFSKNKSVALRKELEDGRTLMEYLAQRFEVVVVTEGNHERRLRRYIEEEIPQDMQFLFPKDIIRVVASGEVLGRERLANVEVVGSWWVKLWDTIYAHPDNYSSAPMRTVINTSQHFLMVRNIPHRVCAIGHTHQAGDIIRGGVKMMETGCLCHDMDYHFGSKFTQAAWTKAHMVQHIGSNGLTEFNSTQVILL